MWSCQSNPTTVRRRKRAWCAFTKLTNFFTYCTNKNSRRGELYVKNVLPDRTGNIVSQRPCNTRNWSPKSKYAVSEVNPLFILVTESLKVGKYKATGPLTEPFRRITYFSQGAISLLNPQSIPPVEILQQSFLFAGNSSKKCDKYMSLRNSNGSNSTSDFLTS